MGLPVVDLTALDVEARIEATPPSAMTRGVFFACTTERVKRLGTAAELAFEHAANPVPRSHFQMYPVRELLRELAIGGAIVRPDDPHEGIREIWRDASSLVAGMPFGGPLLRIARHARLRPLRFLTWLVSNRGTMASYGSWYLDVRAPGYVVIHAEDEYVWLESAHRGGAEGMLELFGVEGTVDAELLGDFRGRLHIRWREDA